VGFIKGQLEYKKFKNGESLTRKEAILANCYACNGQEDSRVNCEGGKTCPLYQYHPYRNA
jgi:hypothetical protein